MCLHAKKYYKRSTTRKSYIKFDCVSLLHSPLAFCGTLSKSERMLSHIGHDIAKHTVNIC